MLGHDGYGRLRLEGRYQLMLKEKTVSCAEKEKSESDADGKNASSAENVKEMEIDEYKFFKRLRILPQAAIRKVHIRISYNDGLPKELIESNEK